jgi:hypothetical protein
MPYPSINEKIMPSLFIFFFVLVYILADFSTISFFNLPSTITERRSQSKHKEIKSVWSLDCFAQHNTINQCNDTSNNSIFVDESGDILIPSAQVQFWTFVLLEIPSIACISYAKS